MKWSRVKTKSEQECISLLFLDFIYSSLLCYDNTVKCLQCSYGGYCPQLKFHLGKPYSQLTAKLLTSPEISRSPRLVLSSGPSPSTESDTETREEIWRRGTGHGKTLQRVIPGYTGYNSYSHPYHWCIVSYVITVISTELSKWWQCYRIKKVTVGWQVSHVIRGYNMTTVILHSMYSESLLNDNSILPVSK